MATKTKEMKVQEQELVQEETERTRECRCFVPRTDIYEVDDNIILELDMPGINQNAIEITLEKNILNVKGYAQIDPPEALPKYLDQFEMFSLSCHPKHFHLQNLQ